MNEAVTEASIPGEHGVLGILPGHAPLLGELGVGELSYTLVTGQRHFMAVGGGYVEISGNHVRVAALWAEFANEIDVARAEIALKRLPPTPLQTLRDFYDTRSGPTEPFYFYDPYETNPKFSWTRLARPRRAGTPSGSTVSGTRPPAPDARTFKSN